MKAVVQPIDRSTTPYDPDAREPVRAARYKASVTILCQPVYRQIGKARTAFEGLAEDVGGYIVVRQKDLTTKGWTPKIGDKIAKIGHKTVEFYVDQPVDFGHWADTDGASLVRVFWADRRGETAKPSYT